MNPSASTAARELRGWRNAVFAAFAMGGLLVATWGPRLPSLQSELDLNTGQLGLLLAGVTVGAVTGLTAAAALLGWLGARRAILVALTTGGLGIALIGVGAQFAHSIGVTAAGFVIVGLGIGAVDVMINVEGAEVESRAGRALMPLMHASWSAGAVFGSLVGAACAWAGITAGVQFIGVAVVVVLIAVISTRAIPPGIRGAQTESRPPVRERVRAWFGAWASKRLLIIGLVMLGVEVGEGTANNWLTLSVRHGHGQSDAVAALFFTAFAVGETTARVVGGPIVDRVGRVRTVRFTTALGVIGVLLFILGQLPWLILIGVLFWSIGVSMGFPLGMSAAAEGGAGSANRVSVVASIGYVANLGGPPAIGFLAESVGLLNAMWLVAIMLAVSFLGAGALASVRAAASRPNDVRSEG
jgi:MFS family permease